MARFCILYVLIRVSALSIFLSLVFFLEGSSSVWFSDPTGYNYSNTPYINGLWVQAVWDKLFLTLAGVISFPWKKRLLQLGLNSQGWRRARLRCSVVQWYRDETNSSAFCCNGCWEAKGILPMPPHPNSSSSYFLWAKGCWIASPKLKLNIVESNLVIRCTTLPRPSYI
jgi:hypothetical protein